MPPSSRAVAFSGPAVARLFGRLFAVVFFFAWMSLGTQIDVLVGRRGLLPAGLFVDWLRARGASFAEAPTLFLWVTPTDAALRAGIAAGASLAALAFAGIVPRLCFALGGALYLSYAVICRDFLAFQWDNMLIECALLAACLPWDRRAPLAQFCLRLLLFKLYFESGIAKWGSPLGDWQDGSAMTFYYETAPLPALFGWSAHALPVAWHHFESRFTLFFELVVPIGIFGPRRVKLAVLVVLTTFQLINVLTANYGFFSYLSLVLHVWLLDDLDLRRAVAWMRRRSRAIARLCALARWLELRSRLPTRSFARVAPRAASAVAVAGAAAYLVASLADATAHFSTSPELVADTVALREKIGPFRAVNTYHLFAAISRERFEVEFQTFDGATWTPHDLRYKPGSVGRAPQIVAPHQPRVDFLLTFYGSGFGRAPPGYVDVLFERICRDPSALRQLFAEPLREGAVAVRTVFYRYRFVTPDVRSATGAWWQREQVWVGPLHACVAQST